MLTPLPSLNGCSKTPAFPATNFTSRRTRRSRLSSARELTAHQYPVLRRGLPVVLSRSMHPEKLSFALVRRPSPRYAAYYSPRGISISDALTGKQHDAYIAALQK